MKLNLFLRPHIKINVKWITDLNIRPKTTKLLEENIRVNFHDLGLGEVPYNTKRWTNKKATDEKLNWTSSKLKILYFKGHYQESEKAHRITEWEKIFANYIYLIIILHVYILQLNNKKTNNPTEKWAKNLNRLYKWPVSTWKDVQHD